MGYTQFFSKKKWVMAGFTCLLYSTSFSAFGLETAMLTVENPLKGELNHSSGEKNNIKAPPRDINVPCDIGDYLTGYVESGENLMTMDVIDATGTVSRRLIDHKSGKQNFYLVAENCDATWRLSGSGAYQVVLEQRVSLASQNLKSALEVSDELLSPTISALRESLQERQSSDGFWAEIEVVGTPLIEDTSAGTLMTFLVR